MSKTRLLVVTRHSPLPENDGAGAALFALLSYLAKRNVRIEITWIKAEGPFVSRGWWRVPAHLAEVADVRIIGSLAIGRFRFFWWGPLEAQILGFVKRILQKVGLWPASPKSTATASSTAGAAAPLASARPSGEPAWSELPTQLETRFARRRLKRFHPHAVLANYCWLTPLLPESRNLRTLVFTHDVAHHRLGMPGQMTSDAGRVTEEDEARLLARAETLLAISEDDAAVFHQLAPGKNIPVVYKAAEPQYPQGTPVRGRCLFVGGVNPPNKEGLDWFLAEVWPRIRAQIPDATLHVCGGISQTVTNAPAGVTLRGRVPNLDSAYGEAEVVVVPLLQGTGIKIKLIEACSFGKACVTTAVGLQGLSFFRDTVAEANSAISFAENVVRVLRDAPLRERLGRGARDAVSSHLSAERCYGPVLQALRSAPKRELVVA